MRVRYIEIAEALGYDYLTDVTNLENISPHKSILICVEPFLKDKDIKKLSKKGVVIGDIHDLEPPKEEVTWYLTSTQNAKKAFQHLGNTHVIPHHHCNFDGKPNPPNEHVRPIWIG